MKKILFKFKKSTISPYEQFNKLNQKHKGPTDFLNTPGYIFELNNVSKTYVNGTSVYHILFDINLKIKRGKFVVILGKSGSGKTTLMNILSGLTRATNGEVIVNNKNLINMSNKELIHFRRKNVGYIFQEYGLLPTLNVYDNVYTGFNLNKANRNKKEIDEILELVDLKEHKKKYPSELSGGQQQRASIARAVVKKPEIIFGDEPTGAVDSVMSNTILKILKDVNKKFNTTVVIITHDEKITEIADTVIVIDSGRIESFYENENPKEIL